MQDGKERKKDNEIKILLKCQISSHCEVTTNPWTQWIKQFKDWKISSLFLDNT